MVGATAARVQDVVTPASLSTRQPETRFHVNECVTGDEENRVIQTIKRQNEPASQYV